ncbi:MAG: methyltransferase domain-containing protein [Mycobacteriales bacterium]
MQPAEDERHDAKSWLAGVFDRAASTYDEMAGAYHDHFGERLVEFAGVRPGDSVLDVGCGRGAVVIPAAARVGPSGRVVGVDLSPEMVRLAQERIDAAAVVAHLSVMDAEQLDIFPGRSFTVVLCGFGIFFLPDAEKALAGFRRVLAPGGTLAVSTWGAEDARWSWEDDLLSDVDVQRRAVRRPFNTQGELDALLRTAGFESVTTATEHHEVRLADADEWWAWKWSYSLRGVLEQLPQDRLERLRRESRERIALMPAESGLPLRLEALMASGRRSVADG